MSRKLLILRHGKSDWSTGVTDFDRPLKERGKRGAEQIGNWLSEQGKIPDYILSSPAVRALSTAELACQAMGQTAEVIHEDSRIYHGSAGELMEALGDVPPNHQRVMIVGHNPGLEVLVLYLTRRTVPIPEDGKLLPTAALAELEMPDDWRHLAEGCANLREYVRSRSLPGEFPYPDETGEQSRPRPAYYYTQSSAIPFRKVRGKTEILIVTSRSGRHWIVPKGIVDPGLTPQESAAKEAMEEAGVEGDLDQSPIGTYDYPKWGGTCTVKVFPLRVNRILDETEWLETHREREWVSPEVAAGRLRQEELRRMVLELANRVEG